LVGLITVTLWTTFATLDLPRIFPAMNRQAAIGRSTSSAAVLVEDGGPLRLFPRRVGAACAALEAAPENTGVFRRCFRPPRIVGAPTLSPLRI
jgi:hypothetical protein